MTITRARAATGPSPAAEPAITDGDLASFNLSDFNPKATTPPMGPEQGRPRDKFHKLTAKQAAPHYVSACLMAAAGAAQFATTVSGEPGIVAATCATVLFVAGVILWIIAPVRYRITTAAKDLGRGWVISVACSILTWLTYTAAAGIDVDTVAALVGGTTVLGLRWWRQHRIPNPSTDPPAPVTPKPVVIDTVLRELEERWLAEVGSKHGVMPGATLSGGTPTDVGEEYLVQFATAHHTVSMLINKLPNIAVGLKCEVSDLIVESVPGDASRARLTILTKSPLKTRTVFDTADIDVGAGRLPLGLWGDGTGYASWRLYTANSMWGGVIIGGIGSGKSVLMAAIAIAARLRGDTITWFIDGQDGASNPALFAESDWAAGRERAKEMLTAAAEEVTWRSRQNRSKRWSGFTPSPTRPGILIQIDECHLIFDDPECVALAEYIARVGRKVGIALVCASQYAGAKTFGGSVPLRSSLMQGNAVVLYTTSKAEKNFFNGLELDPSQLPSDMPGFGYVIDAAGGKMAPFRGRDFERLPEVDDLDQDNLPDAEADLKHSITWWLRQCPEILLDTLSVTAADAVTGGGYTQRRERQAEDLGRWDDQVAAMEQGILPADYQPGVDSPTTRPAATGPVARLLQLVPPRLSDFLRRSPASPTTTVPPMGLSPAEEAVWMALADAESGLKLGQLVAATDYSETYVRGQLDNLIEAGHVEQPKKFGPYQLTNPAAETVAA
ncbi:MarR family transcriptional regulator [Stackebrandtia nassauensis]|uniref:Cell division FtsK/SpoIIIE n=1 Tax=Stackebrandtia nassauensis (strain DSM 44728 / CIP 108903 / NRRL B-16338 / NBRC 102104 / LLR-40K-21) TaxID=446470 RepID=D3Q388_STANL|nr:MarR family transcriptional regulator [Stackebrandtia nassauensis]ADD40058.1 cell division FtsK/SpoIIIE [Stackebrandtia nassauensis DSM 44728]